MDSITSSLFGFEKNILSKVVVIYCITKYIEKSNNEILMKELIG
ncbi:12876_t:CDS:2 [Entrophospora sp. SA101]|nr:12876_t:CDS:2 [Entrophospora sp. SA101]